jgi:hypothetical protein
MQAFCAKHATKIAGVLSCFDRMLFRGYLPIMHGAAMAQFLRSEEVNCRNLRQFLLETSECVKGHAQRMADDAGRPYIYLPGGGVRMEEHARQLAERDGIRRWNAKIRPTNHARSRRLGADVGARRTAPPGSTAPRQLTYGPLYALSALRCRSRPASSHTCRCAGSH